MSFKESVLIPLEIFRKMQIFNNENRTTKEKILNDETIDSHAKLKLLKREAFKSPSKVTQSTSVPRVKRQIEKDADIKMILEDIDQSLRGNARKALDLIFKYPDIIRWGSDFTVYIKNTEIEASDMRDIFAALFYTSGSLQGHNIPGVQLVYDALLDIGANKTWFTYQPQIRNFSSRYSRSGSVRSEPPSFYNPDKSESELQITPKLELSYGNSGLDDLPKLEISNNSSKPTASEPLNKEDVVNEEEFRKFLSVVSPKVEDARASSPINTDVSTEDGALYTTAASTDDAVSSASKNVDRDISMQKGVDVSSVASSSNEGVEDFVNNASTVKRKSSGSEKTKRKLHARSAASTSLIHARKKDNPTKQNRSVSGIKPSKLRQPKEVKFVTPRRLRSNKILPSWWIPYKDIK